MYKEHLSAVQHFISCYRELEKAPSRTTEDIIKYVVKDKDVAESLCGSWKIREQNWGTFYLNLDHGIQYGILKFWGLGHPAADEYAQKLDATPELMVLAEVPTRILLPHHLLRFFNNRGISDNPADGVFLTRLPGKDRRFGNSANWGDYLLSLPQEAQKSVIEQIAEYAQSNYSN